MDSFRYPGIPSLMNEWFLWGFLPRFLKYFLLSIRQGFLHGFHPGFLPRFLQRLHKFLQRFLHYFLRILHGYIQWFLHGFLLRFFRWFSWDSFKQHSQIFLRIPSENFSGICSWVPSGILPGIPPNTHLSILSEISPASFLFFKRKENPL